MATRSVKINVPLRSLKEVGKHLRLSQSRQDAILKIVESDPAFGEMKAKYGGRGELKRRKDFTANKGSAAPVKKLARADR